MNLEELTDAEKTALGRMVRLVVRLDGTTAAERQRLDEIAGDLGEDLFWNAVEESRSSTWSFKQCVETVERKPARELIYGVLLAISFVGTIDEAERNALDALAEAWEVEEQLLESSEAGEAGEAEEGAE